VCWFGCFVCFEDFVFGLLEKSTALEKFEFWRRNITPKEKWSVLRLFDEREREWRNFSEFVLPS
jgi:hypothetical protein